MNNKKSILDAWIKVEQLSEGDINKNASQYRQFTQSIVDFKSYFSSFMSQQKDNENLTDEKFKSSGIVVYFGIFKFQEIIEFLRQKYRICPTHEETSNSDKFTFALYFDKDFNFISDKFFFTISGYIRYKRELPSDFQTIEADLNNQFEKKFTDQHFNDVFNDLLKQFSLNLNDCRYAFVKNLENADVNLHSFFIDDLLKAKKINTNNLSRYFTGFTGKRLNLDGNKDSENFNPALFEEILQPKFYPLGRFPSNPNYSLSLMQQVAVNLALNDKNEIRSVNGPPGTGKTTLLKEIFADLVVQQAWEICNLPQKYLKATLTYSEPYKVAVLPPEISSKGIVVASSNNGAVQNIVNELPLIESTIYTQKNEEGEVNQVTDLKEKLLAVDYFREPAKNEAFWGTFSLEGGKSQNLSILLNTVESIFKALSDSDYQPNPNVYSDFKASYLALNSKKQACQKYADDIKKFNNLKNEKRVLEERLNREKVIKVIELEKQIDIQQKLKAKFFEENREIKLKLDNVSIKVDESATELGIVQSALLTLQMQKPSFLGLQKLFNSLKVQKYFNELNVINDKINHLLQLKNEFSQNRDLLSSKYEANETEINQINHSIQNYRNNYQKWITQKDQTIEQLKRKIGKLKPQISNNEFSTIDFAVDYETFQKSNFWFDKEFRQLQSELFIQSLAVRKQFLYENKKHLEKSIWIWKEQSKYFSRVNGQELIQTAWEWINFAIPVISTTFASFGRMFRNLDINSLGNLFIDEAGQALPQASVGAIFRSKRVMVVGDPSQIKPVLTLDTNMLNLIAEKYKVTEQFVSNEVSTQSLVDNTSQYGFWKNETEWIGIPLWVHRRSNYPMFTISNDISYNSLMVQGKNEVEAYGKSEWFDQSGIASDKFVKEQAEFLKQEISRRLQENPELADEIYVISPFRNVAYHVAKSLDEIHFTKRDNKYKATNVGTVHTFQGKEAKIVYFVLGTDKSSIGAAKWAVSNPNIMNVAATRAKEEFYIIGDKALYANLGSEVATLTISIITEYNKK